MKTGRPPPYTRFDTGGMGKGGAGRSWWARIRSGTGSLLTNTVSSAAGTAGAVLGIQAVLPAPNPPQDFKNANLMSPKFQDTHALINGNFDAGSSWMVILGVVASTVVLGLACWCVKCRKWIPTIGEKRQEIREEKKMQNSTMNEEEAQLKEWLTTNPWSKVEQGRYPPWAAVPPTPRNWEYEEGPDSLKMAVARCRARQQEEEDWREERREERREEWEEKEKKEEAVRGGEEEEDKKGGGKKGPTPPRRRP